MTAAIDTHVHLWDLSRFSYPWLEAEGQAELRADYLLDDLLADLGGVSIEGLVHVQAEMDHALDPVLETAWLDAVFAAAPPGTPPMLYVGYADLRASDLGETLARHAAHERVRGIRQELWFEPGSTEPGIETADLMADPAWRAGLRLLPEHDFLFEALVAVPQLAQARRVFREVPGLRVVLEHTGVPTLVDGAPPAGWVEGLEGFAAEVPDSVLKVSALGFIKSGWELDEVAPVVRRAIEIFGPSRVMLGSNYPVERLDSSYARVWAAYEEIASELSETEREEIFAGTARRVYGFEGAP